MLKRTNCELCLRYECECGVLEDKDKRGREVGEPTAEPHRVGQLPTNLLKIYRVLRYREDPGPRGRRGPGARGHRLKEDLAIHVHPLRAFFNPPTPGSFQ